MTIDFARSCALGACLILLGSLGHAASSTNTAPLAQRAQLEFSSAPPLGGQFGTAYSHSFVAGGGVSAPTYSVASGNLPSGLNLTSAGVLSGTPLAVGIFTGSIRASNGVDQDAVQAFSIAIAGARPSAATITNIVVGDGTALVYFDRPTFTGGLPLYYNVICTGGVVGADSNPPIAATKLPNGVPTTCMVNSINSAGYTLTPMSAPVVPGIAPAFTSAPVGNGTFGLAYSASLAGSGAPAPTFTVESGALPDGVTLDASGVISGTPTAVGNFTGSFRASNGVGAAASQNFAITIVATVPAPPSIDAAIAGNAAVSVSFTAPSNTGGSAITGYRANCGSQSAEGPNSPITVDGLSNGVAVSCRVTARNAIGESIASAASNSVTPATVPDAPVIGAASAGVGSAIVNFTAPGNTGGSAITGYRASCGNQSASGPGSPITVNGLSSGVAVTCSVSAQNAIGDGNASVLSNSVIPQGVPAAPTIGLATAGVAAVTVNFTPSNNTGGLTISGYRATCGGQSANGLNAPITVAGLTNGVAVSCTVVASNSLGDSAPSASSNSVTPAGVPAAPTIGTASAGNGAAIISFNTPSNNGGSAITGYSASCLPGVHLVNGLGSPLQVGGLSNDVIYTCSVSAINAIGNSLPSAGVNVIPSASTSAEISITKTNSTNFVSGGYPVTYAIEINNAGPAGAASVRVTDTLADVFSSASWSCASINGSRCRSVTGTGNLDELVDLPPASSARFLITATLAAFPENPISNITSATPPSGISDPSLTNNVATDGPDVVGLKRDGFE